MLRVTSAAREVPGGLAIIAGDQALSFGELATRVGRLCEAVALQCPDHEQPVAFVAHPTLDSLILSYALLELGRPLLPLNPRLLASDHEFLIEQAGAREVALTTGGLRVVRIASRRAQLSVRRPAVLMATSGSTGRAKLVQLSSEALVAAATASAERLLWMKEDRWLLSLSLCHIGGLSIVTRCLLARKPVVLGEPRVSPAELTELIRRQGVTLVSLVSTQLHRLLAEERSLQGSKLRVMLLGGMHADPWLVAAARTSALPVLTTYGMTETASQIATQHLGDLRSLIGPCHDVGTPLAGVELRLIGDEIVVRGPMLFEGYVPDDAAPALEGPPASVHAPASVIRGMQNDWFHTGDWGRLDGRGRLTVIGRSADRIVTSGENVAPAEVERVLEALPAVERACAFGVHDPVRDQVVAVALVIREGFTFNAADFEHQVRQRLAPFKRPRSVAIVSEFATTPTGKLDRRGTEQLAAPKLQSVSVTHTDG